MAATIGPVIPWYIPCDTPGNVTLSVYGSGFTGTDKINYDGSDVTTVLVSDTLLQMTLNPSGASGPRNVKIKVTGDPTVKYFQWTPGPIAGTKGTWLANT